MKVQVKKLNEHAQLPMRASEEAAGYDLFVCSENPILIPPHETVKIPTGLSFALPKNTFAAIFGRSGLATKSGLRPANCVGICDADYRGQYIVALHNDSAEVREVSPGERVAQMVLLPYFPMELEEVNELNETNRGIGGFGSTGI